MRQSKSASLRQQLLLWLLLPQIFLWLIGATISYFVAIRHANDLIDQDLLQTARSLTAITRAHINEPPAHLVNDVHQLMSTTNPHTYYSAHIIGQPTLFSNFVFPPKPYKTSAYYEYNHQALNTKNLRIITLVEPFPHPAGKQWLVTEVAQSDQTHDLISWEIFSSVFIPLALLISLTSALVWWGIGRGLIPLKRLQTQLETRNPNDLSPFEFGEVPRELATLFDALNHLLSSAAENINRQRRFIGDAAHQLRTPLAGLKSQTELAMREGNPQAQRDRLTMVHTSATRSIHLVNQLLTLARSEPGNHGGILRVDMDLVKLIRELTAEAVPRSIAAGIDLGCDIALNEAHLQGNSALLRELFVNLVENAIKYIPRGGCVTVRLNEENGFYVVEVEDDGNGIPDEDKERVFERFYRRQQDGNGCGLGMSIVREIAERHGGNVVLADAQPHGLIVRVTLARSI